MGRRSELYAIVWVKHHAGHKLCTLTVIRAELLRLNQMGYAETPEELKPSVFALAKLEVKVFGKNKESLRP